MKFLFLWFWNIHAFTSVQLSKTIAFLNFSPISFRFLTTGGWGILNKWLHEFTKSENFPVLLELIDVSLLAIHLAVKRNYFRFPKDIDFLKTSSFLLLIYFLCPACTSLCILLLSFLMNSFPWLFIFLLIWALLIEKSQTRKVRFLAKPNIA